MSCPPGSEGAGQKRKSEMAHRAALRPYLHQLDRYWWERYGNLHRKEKERRRLAHKGNCALIRYADDWVRHEARVEHDA
jgi:hypothetical protein